jgi:hypothetical protein
LLRPGLQPARSLHRPSSILRHAQAKPIKAKIAAKVKRENEKKKESKTYGTAHCLTPLGLSVPFKVEVVVWSCATAAHTHSLTALHHHSPVLSTCSVYTCRINNLQIKVSLPSCTHLFGIAIGNSTSQHWPNTALPFSSFLSFVIRSTCTYTARFSELSHTFHCGENINQWVEFRLSMPLAL